MSVKGSRHRVGNYTEYGNNLEDLREKAKKAREENTEHCEKHTQFNPYCVKCWDMNELNKIKP